MILYRVGSQIEQGLECFKYYRSKDEAMKAIKRALEAGDRVIKCVIINTAEDTDNEHTN